MSSRLDDLEKNIGELMKQAGVEEQSKAEEGANGDEATSS